LCGREPSVLPHAWKGPAMMAYLLTWMTSWTMLVPCADGKNAIHVTPNGHVARVTFLPERDLESFRSPTLGIFWFGSGRLRLHKLVGLLERLRIAGFLGVGAGELGECFKQFLEPSALIGVGSHG
jgi:hypothetical protein